MWTSVVEESVPHIARHVPSGSRVLEVGYGDGLLTCWLAARLGWKVVGLDVRPDAHLAAVSAVHNAGLDGQVDLRLVHPSYTRRHQGEYDAVFVKTVFYSSASVAEYEEWLDWTLNVLRPGGVLVSYESGRANRLTQAYRWLRGREYTNLCLYTQDIEGLYDARFRLVYRQYYGGLSQFLSPLPGVYECGAALERALAPRSAANCFVVSMVMKKPAEN